MALQIRFSGIFDHAVYDTMQLNVSLWKIGKHFILWTVKSEGRIGVVSGFWASCLAPAAVLGMWAHAWEPGLGDLRAANTELNILEEPDTGVL